MEVTVVDYGMGNLGSILNMLRHLGHQAVIASSASDVAKAQKLILPGVGSFDPGMERLHKNELVDVLNDMVLAKKIPILGICLGLHLMARSSEEGSAKGLGWLDTNVIKFTSQKTSYPIRLPHMGWNTAKPGTRPTLLDPNHEHRFYFVHSYHLEVLPTTQILCTTHHGYEFVSGVCHGNIYGVQFHPEKSHRFGMQLLTNFINDV